MILRYQFGYALRECEWFTIPGTPYQERRSWRDRLCTRPWRPWIAFRTITPQIPDPAVYRIGDALYGHPDTLRTLKQELIP